MLSQVCFKLSNVQSFCAPAFDLMTTTKKHINLYGSVHAATYLKFKERAGGLGNKVPIPQKPKPFSTET